MPIGTIHLRDRARRIPVAPRRRSRGGALTAAADCESNSRPSPARAARRPNAPFRRVPSPPLSMLSPATYPNSRAAPVLLCVARHLDLAPGSRAMRPGLSIRNVERSTPMYLARTRLLDPHAVGRHPRPCPFGGEADCEVVLPCGTSWWLAALRAHADDLDAGLAKIRCQAGEVFGPPPCSPTCPSLG